MAKKKPIKVIRECTTCTSSYIHKIGLCCKIRTKEQNNPTPSSIVDKEECGFYVRKKNYE